MVIDCIPGRTAIDLGEDTAWLPVSTVAHRYLRERKTVLNWIKRGIETSAGRVYLEAQRVGGLYLTTEGWLATFMAALEGGYARPVAAPAGKTARRARAEQARARKVMG